MLSSFLLELSIFLDHALFLTEHGFIMKTSCHKKSLVEIFHNPCLYILLLCVSDGSCCTKHSAPPHLSACLSWFVQEKQRIFNIRVCVYTFFVCGFFFFFFFWLLFCPG